MIGHRSFPRVIQWTDYTCAPCCVYAITRHFGLDAAYEKIKKTLGTSEDGTSETPIIRFLRSRELRVSPRDRMTWRQLTRVISGGNVVLAGFDGDHYGVIHGIDEEDVYLMDPSIVRMVGSRIPIRRFMNRWMKNGIAVRRRGARARSRGA